ncbi:hypothetical protein MJH12_07440 [bacterium]|nr:hypothetical protein [bacterium]
MIQFAHYKKTPLGQGSVIQKHLSPYVIAQSIQQDFFHLINRRNHVTYRGKEIYLNQRHIDLIYTMLNMLEKEFILLHEDLEDLKAKLEIDIVELIVEENPISTPPLMLHSIEIHQKNANSRHHINAQLNFQYEQNDQLKAKFQFNSYSSKSTSRSLGTNKVKSDLDLEEAYLIWKPKTSIKQIHLGKYHKHLGLGLAQSANVEGLELEKLYHDYQIKVGYFDGIFASITTPHILDIPFTFYSIRRKLNQSNLVDATHSGLYFNKVIKSLHISSEVSEYQDHNSFKGIGNANKSSAFALSLQYNVDRRMTISSSLTHLGQNYQTRQRLKNLHTFNSVSNNPMKDFYYSMSGYFAKNLISINGISNLSTQLAYQLNPNNHLSLQYDQIYDHSSDNRNRFNELNLTTLRITHQTHKNYHLQASLQYLDFATVGQSLSGFLVNQQKKDGTLFRSSIRYQF